MGRKRKNGNHFPQKNNFKKDSEGNEENGYLVPHPNKTMINETKEPSNAYKNTLQEGIIENFMEKILDMVTKMYKMHSRNFNTPKITNM
jgi:hypothetical protein